MVIRAQGLQLTDKYVARWQLTAPSNWTTSHFSFSATVQGKDNWSSSIAASGNQPTGLPAPGLDAGVDLSSALDIDLGRCPMTNRMPIRWLGRLEDDVVRTPFIMAWIDMPLCASSQATTTLPQQPRVPCATSQEHGTSTSSSKSTSTEMPSTIPLSHGESRPRITPGPLIVSAESNELDSSS
ncbi:putative glycolipid-binding domain-containing protein [Corynebacterium phoceense]|uniref:putative glycolipid-binding domain-containing protein n=1 Tax=Corynebacterium phoceense TaxID=1686286 RepID=UPI0034CFCA63